MNPLGGCVNSPQAGAARPETCTCGDHSGCRTHGPQPRERSVPCRICGRWTFAHDAKCETHREGTK